MSDSLQLHGQQHIRLPCPSPSPGVCSNSSSLSQWYHPTIYPVSFPSPPAFNLSQHQGLFQSVGSSHQVAKLWELQLQHQSFQLIFSVDFLYDWLVWSPCRYSQVSSLALQFENINFSVLSLLYGLTFTSVHDYWKNHSLEYMDLYWQSNVSAF